MVCPCRRVYERLCATVLLSLYTYPGSQGPVLEARGLPIGVVTGIAGQTRLWVHVNGTQVGTLS